MKNTMIVALVVAGFVAGGLLGGLAMRWDRGAMMQDDGMAGHDMGHTPWSSAFQAANDAMHKGMMIQYSDNPDLDFARGMIAHHQGAVAMAKIELDHGKDPEIRKLAEGVIAAQQAEIAQMQAWIAQQ